VWFRVEASASPTGWMVLPSNHPIVVMHREARIRQRMRRESEAKTFLQGARKKAQAEASTRQPDLFGPTSDTSG